MSGEQSRVAIVCISLPGATTRRARMTQFARTHGDDLAALGADFFFQDAVDGRRLAGDVSALLRAAIRQSPQAVRQLGPAEIGCLLSHLLVLARFVDGDLAGYRQLVVVEDDVSLAGVDLVSMLGAALDEPGGFAFLGGFPAYNAGKIFGYRRGFAFRMTGPRYWYTRSCAYLVDQARAGRLLRRAIAAPFVADNWEYLLETSFVPYYPLFLHDDELPSSLESERCAVTPRDPAWLRWRRRLERLRGRLACWLAGRRAARLSTMAGECGVSAEQGTR